MGENEKVEETKEEFKVLPINDIINILYADEERFLKLYEENIHEWKTYCDALYETRFKTLYSVMPDLERFSGKEKIENYDDKLLSIISFIKELKQNLNNISLLAETLNKLSEVEQNAILLENNSPKYFEKITELFALMTAKQSVDYYYISNLLENEKELINLIDNIEKQIKEVKNGANPEN